MSILEFAVYAMIGVGLAAVAFMLSITGDTLNGTECSIAALGLLVVGLLTPCVAYFIYLLGSIVPEVFTLLSRIESNTRNDNSPKGPASPDFE